MVKRKNTVVCDFSSDDSDSPDSAFEAGELADKQQRSDSDSEISESDDDWTVDGKGGKKKKKTLPKKTQDASQSSSSSSKEEVPSSEPEESKVSDSASGSGEASESDIEFSDGYDENFMGDEADKARLAQMTEREREMEIYNRVEMRETLKPRFEIWKRLAKKKEQKMQEK